MSADLFAAFGQPNTSRPSSASPPLNNNSPSKESQRPASAFDTLIDSSASPQRLGNTEIKPDIGSTRRPKASSPAYPFKPSEAGGNEILFDATTEIPHDSDDGDDWGEFETAQPGNPGPAAGLLIDLPESTSRSTVVNPADDKRGGRGVGQEQRRADDPQSAFDLLSADFSQENETTNTGYISEVASKSRDTKKKATKPIQDTPELFSSLASHREEEDEDEDWGDFTDGIEPVKPSSKQNQATTTPKHASHPFSDSSRATEATREQTPNSQIRPTNIPPPAILLPLFPPLLERLQRKYATSGSSQEEAQRRAASELPHELSGILKAMIRVLLGRSLRWRRDSILSQSTKIGPARAGKSGGMKLNSVNKSESVKEDKEAVEVQDAWKKRAGVFNSIMAATGGQPIPSMAGGLQVKTATAQEGALKSSHACGLCGLKREERISKIDDNANDSFGEWWTEHWGHSECRRFWEEHSGLLEQR